MGCAFQKGNIQPMLNKEIFAAAGKIMEDGPDALSYEEACRLTALPDDDLFDLMFCAFKIKRHFKKDNLIICSIVNAKSGLCPEDCAFCAQSAHHETRINTYPMLAAEEMVERAAMLNRQGAGRYSMVTSGYMLSDDEAETVCRSARSIVEQTQLTVCGSLGNLTPPLARRLKDSGISIYHHNLETARSFFSQVCTTHTYDEDIETVRIARSAGMKVCSGGILGLGETWEQRVELAFAVKALDVDGIPINFLNPIAGTKLADRPLLSPMEALKCISLFRFINPDKDILICGGREVTLRDFQSWIFLAGANGLMVGNYLTTTGRDIGMDMAMIRSMPGHSLSF